MSECDRPSAASSPASEDSTSASRAPGGTAAGKSNSIPSAQRVLAKHWPDVQRHADVRTFPPCESHNHGQGCIYNYPDCGYPCDHRKCGWGVDLICGGFPCQPVSVSGKRLAQADERWLWPEFARVVRALRPRFVLVENVSGLLGRGAGDVLGDLAACGYDAEWNCIPAAALGADHVRDRVWIVAYPDGWRREVFRFPQPRRVERQSRRFPDRRCGVWQFDDLPSSCESWASEPGLGRVAHGVPARVDRLRALGNAIVPQVAEWIGRRLMAAIRPEGA